MMPKEQIEMILDKENKKWLSSHTKFWLGLTVDEILALQAENARLAAEIEQLKRELHIATGSRQALALELQIVQAQLEQA